MAGEGPLAINLGSGIPLLYTPGCLRVASPPPFVNEKMAIAITSHPGPAERVSRSCHSLASRWIIALSVSQLVWRSVWVIDAANLLFWLTNLDRKKTVPIEPC